MKYSLYPHGGSGNHGCEAIVKATSLLLNGDMHLYSSSPQQDFAYGLDAYCSIHADHQVIERLSLDYLKALYHKWISCDIYAFDKLHFAPVIHSVEKGDFFLSIGGDNYCYGTPDYIYLINTEVRKRNAKTILWGCSIEESGIDLRMQEDLSSYDLIYARESLTATMLKKHGIHRVVCFPDPAFILPTQEVQLPDQLAHTEFVGINISPMIVQNESVPGLTMKNYIELIQYILTQTSFSVALIPHVVWSHNDDRVPLQQLSDYFSSTGRVVMIPDNNALYLKGIIGKCRFMIAARTHASIAAYSQQVPTLVVGYSVKAQGIATDLFGTTEHYVLPVQNMDSPHQLTQEFEWMRSQEETIRSHYSHSMPTYIDQLKGLSELLMQL